MTTLPDFFSLACAISVVGLCPEGFEEFLFASRNGIITEDSGQNDQADKPLDPRGPDHSRQGIFVYHNCWKCRDGELPCAQGHTLNCEYPHARND